MPQSDWAVTWVAVGAISLALMALLQVGAVVALLKVALKAQKAMRGLQAEVAPLIDRGQALLSTAGDVVAHAQSVVHQAEAAVSNVADRVKYLDRAVTVASDGVREARQGLQLVTARASGVLSGARAFWSVIRGRGRGGLHYGRQRQADLDPFREWRNG
jgi:hypothetical protein